MKNYNEVREPKRRPIIHTVKACINGRIVNRYAIVEGEKILLYSSERCATVKAERLG